MNSKTDGQIYGLTPSTGGKSVEEKACVFTLTRFKMVAVALLWFIIERKINDVEVHPTAIVGLWGNHLRA